MNTEEKLSLALECLTQVKCNLEKAVKYGNVTSVKATIDYIGQIQDKLEKDV